MKIIFNIKDIRVKQNISLQKLSKMSGVSKSHINDIENQNKMPSIEVLILLSKALHTDIKDLYNVKN